MSTLKTPNEFTQKVVDRFYPPNGELPGVGFGWSGTDYLRCAPGELSVWSGFNGHGKSLMLGQVLLNFATKGEVSVIASMEMPAHATLYRLVRQAMGGVVPSSPEIAGCLKWMSYFIVIYDKTGTASVDVMLDSFRQARATYGATQFVIDSLTKCGIAEDDFAGQKRLTERFHDFAMEESVHVHLVAHAKKPSENGERRPPRKYDILGASGISNIANNVFICWRNKVKEEFAEGPDVLPCDALLLCDKSREYGGDAEKGYAFYFHKESMQYLREEGDVPRRYYKVSGVPF